MWCIEETRVIMILDSSPKRPPRRTPTHMKIAKYHNITIPQCMRCGWYPPTTDWKEAHKYLQRAHIIDRVYGGLDLPANMAPLCVPCHDRQPSWEPGHEALALSWFYRLPNQPLITSILFDNAFSNMRIHEQNRARREAGV